MKKINVKLDNGRSYGIAIEKGLCASMPENIRTILKDRKFLAVTDSNIRRIYKSRTEDMFGRNVFVIKAGEKSKNIVSVKNICGKCVKAGLDRGSVIIAFGGGVVGDISGFAASVFMRGVDYVQIPTTLLAMVDSSVGGKTGVDIPEGKNLVGSFWQPKAVAIDTSFLSTLPCQELKCGLAEIAKYGMILDGELWGKLENNIGRLKKPDLGFYEDIISRCCALKAKIVSQDERESGLRAILNYGHTFGHAIEKLGGFSKYSHGEAVAIGMCMAANFAVQTGILHLEVANRQFKLLDAIGLPTKISLAPEKIYKSMFSDKKVKAGKLQIIIPVKIGKTTTVENPPMKDVIAAIKSCCEDL